MMTRRAAGYGAALAATLALCAWTAVRESAPQPVPVLARAARGAPAAMAPAPKVMAAPERDPLVDTPTDPFAPVSFLPPPPTPVPVERTVAAVALPAPAPVAPPFPFRYVGRMTGIDGSTGIYIASDQELLQVRAGQVVAGSFRIDAIDDKQIALTYLPLDEPAILATPTAAR